MYTLADMEPATPTARTLEPALDYNTHQALNAYMVARKHLNEYLHTGATIALMYAGLALGDAHRYVDLIGEREEQSRAQRLHRNIVWAFEDICTHVAGGRLGRTLELLQVSERVSHKGIPL